jgi:hypothetical protein
MQPIHRTSCQAIQAQATQAQTAGYPAGLLADLIDGQARMPPSAAPGANGLKWTDPPGANALIWVEDGPGLAAARKRGLLVVAHGASQAAKERSCVISYPASPADDGQDILAVSERLTEMGWQLLSCLDQATGTGHASIAMLVSRALPGMEQRLWLVAPAAPLPKDRIVPTQAPAGQDAPAVPPTYPAGPGVPAAPGTHDQVEDWVNEGGAGDDVAT